MNNHHYPDAPGHRGVDTSVEAAATVDANYLRGLVLRCLESHIELSPDECAAALGLSVLSIRPRFTELLKKRLIERTGRRAKNASGKSAHVCRIATSSSSAFVLQYRQTLDGTESSQSLFWCEADDYEHAVEQLQNAIESEGEKLVFVEHYK
jgi:predicted ArsR family transcriptional regulator